MASTMYDYSAATVRTLPEKPKRGTEYTDLICAIGARLRAARVVAGLSQEKLANAIGVSFQQLQKYEKGGNRISAAQLVRVARGLGCDPASLMPPIDTETENGGDPLGEIAAAVGGVGSDGRAILFALSGLPPSAMPSLRKVVETMALAGSNTSARSA